MFNDLNQCNFTGRLGKNPEVRTFSNGNKVCSFSLAVGESWKDKGSGDRKSKTEWVNVAAFGDGLVGLIERTLRKGSRVALRGKLATRKWQDQSGNDRYSTEVVLQGFDAFIQCMDEKGSGQQSSNDRWSGSGDANSQSSAAFDSDLDDDLGGDLSDSVPF